MFLRILTLSIPVTLVLTLGAPAQETGTTGPDLGQPVPQTPAQPAEYAREEHGDWAIRCLTNPDGEDPCSLYQLMYNDQGSPVAEISIFPVEGADNGAVAGATFVAPLETYLPAGVTMAVDGEEARRYPFEFCGEIGCFARLGLTDASLATFRQGNMARLVIIPAQARDREVVVEMSLDGFTAGYAALGN